MKPNMLTVEIHDVSPATKSEFEVIREALLEIGVCRYTLLLIPHHQDSQGQRFDLRDDGKLVSSLREAQENGSELVQHGYSHRAVGTPPPGFGHFFLHRFFSRGCAEFAYLSEEQARERLQAGLMIFRECGLRTQGFIAPAWLQSPAAIRTVRKMGYGFTAFLNHVLPLKKNPRALYTPALTFDASDVVIDYGKRLVMRAFEFFSRRSPLLRVAIHPADVHRSYPLRHILRRIQELLTHRKLTTYAEWLA